MGVWLRVGSGLWGRLFLQGGVHVHVVCQGWEQVFRVPISHILHGNLVWGNGSL